MIINGNAKVSASDKEKIIQSYFVNDEKVDEYTFKIAKQIEKLQQEKADLLECVKFYARDSTWLGVSDSYDLRSKWIRAVEDDMDASLLGGKKARECLKKYLEGV
jgi:hypothetical protein